MADHDTAYYDTLDSPIGSLFIGGTAEGLARIDFMADAGQLSSCLARLEAETSVAVRRGGRAGEGACADVQRQLRSYFAGERLAFDLPLAPRGTVWQRGVWAALRDIPAGETASYGTIAARLGRPAASRAVGAAIGRNPLAIVVPCHRVIGSDGALTGYAGGLHRKRWLLAHEGVRLDVGGAIGSPQRDARISA